MKYVAREIKEIAKLLLSNATISKRPLGKTGFDVCIFSLGGQGALERRGNPENCRDIIRRAYELGINYFDTSPVYGPSEDLYGDVIPAFRDEIFLATKTHERSRDKSLALLEKSLKRLKTDYVDLWQIHSLTNVDEIDEVVKPGGALQALVEMRDQGIVRYLGFTGHESPDVLMEMMNRFDFDTVLCPANSADIAMDKSFYSVMASAMDRDMGVVGMKAFAQGHIFHPKGITTAWEPLTLAMSCPVSTVIVGHDNVPQLEENVAIAKAFQQLNPEQFESIVEKAKPYVKRGAFFRKEHGGYGSQDKLGEPYTISNIKPGG